MLLKIDGTAPANLLHCLCYTCLIPPNYSSETLKPKPKPLNLKGAVTLANFSCNLSRNFLVATALHSVTPLQLASQCFARSANQDPYYPLLGPPRSQFCELLAVPLHSVTALFVQLQCYAFKRCETSCMQKMPSVTVTAPSSSTNSVD